MQKIPRVQEEVGVAGDPQRLRPCGPKERGERLKGDREPHDTYWTWSSGPKPHATEAKPHPQVGGG